MESAGDGLSSIALSGQFRNERVLGKIASVAYGTLPAEPAEESTCLKPQCSRGYGTSDISIVSTSTTKLDSTVTRSTRTSSRMGSSTTSLRSRSELREARSVKTPLYERRLSIAVSADGSLHDDASSCSPTPHLSPQRDQSSPTRSAKRIVETLPPMSENFWRSLNNGRMTHWNGVDLRKAFGSPGAAREVSPVLAKMARDARQPSPNTASSYLASPQASYPFDISTLPRKTPTFAGEACTTAQNRLADPSSFTGVYRLQNKDRSSSMPPGSADAGIRFRHAGKMLAGRPVPLLKFLGRHVEAPRPEGGSCKSGLSRPSSAPCIKRRFSKGISV